MRRIVRISSSALSYPPGKGSTISCALWKELGRTPERSKKKADGIISRKTVHVSPLLMAITLPCLLNHIRTAAVVQKVHRKECKGAFGKDVNEAFGELLRNPSPRTGGTTHGGTGEGGEFYFRIHSKVRLTFNFVFYVDVSWPMR